MPVPELARAILAAPHGPFDNGRVIGVSMEVGATALTRMPCGASSTAMALVRPSIAHLVMQ